MSALSSRDLRREGQDQPPVEVKSGPHSIADGRVQEATSDVHRVLHGGTLDKQRVHPVDKVLSSTLSRTIDRVIGTSLDEKFVSLASEQASFLVNIKKLTLEFDKLLPDSNAPTLTTVVPNLYKIRQAAKKLQRLPQAADENLKQEAFRSEVEAAMHPFLSVVASHREYLKGQPVVLRRLVVILQYTTEVIANMIKGQAIALKRSSEKSSAISTLVPSSLGAVTVSSGAGKVLVPENSGEKVASGGTSEVTRLTASASVNKDVPLVKSIVDDIVAKMPVNIMGRVNKYYASKPQEEASLRKRTSLQTVIAKEIGGGASSYQDLQLAFEKVDGHLAAANMLTVDTVFGAAARIMRDLPASNADMDTIIDSRIATYALTAMNYFGKQIQASLPAAKVAELKPSIEKTLTKIRISYTHALAIAVRAFILNSTIPASGLSATNAPSASFDMLPDAKPEPQVLVRSDNVIAKPNAEVPDTIKPLTKEELQAKHIDASTRVVANTRKSFRNVLLAAAMSAFAGIKDMSSSAPVQNVNSAPVRAQPAATIATPRQSSQSAPVAQTTVNNAREAAEIAAITGTVEISVAGTIQGAINTALHQMNVDSAARTLNEPRNALALWAARYHHVTLGNTQLNLLINALTHRLANTEMNTGRQDSPKAAWHAGMPNSKRLRVTYRLGREPSFTVTLLDTNPSRSELGNVTASFSVTPQMLIEGRAWEAVPRPGSLGSLVTDNPYDPPQVPIF